MLFNSYIFWAYFACVFLVYRALPHKGQNRMLLLASYIFYGAWDWRFLSLIFLSTVVDYFAARGLANTVAPIRRKALVILSISANLGILGFFKYYDFFAGQMQSLLGVIGLNASLPVLHVILPVGISFYTFQTMSYTIDVYRGETEPVRSFWDFALYVCFFPQLVAGPIERSSRLMPQILQPRHYEQGDFAEGLYLVLMGLFRKIVVADNMAPIVNAIFTGDPAELSGPACWAGVYAFAFQIYCDFSGYSCIAQGISRWLGFRLMDNFNTPYFATDPSDFWRRWHISLSTWLRDYLYIPLGGNRHGRWQTYRNLILTMTLGGLWHGAGWTFILWGVYHGMLLSVYRLLPHRSQATNSSSLRGALVRAGKTVVMFHLICFGWLLFRAESMAQVGAMLARMTTDFQFTPLANFALATVAFYALPLLGLELWLYRRADLMALVRTHWAPRALAYSYTTSMILLFAPVVNHEFIYFQF